MLVDLILKLGRKIRYWSPVRISRLVWGAFISIPRQLEIFRVLRRSALAGLASRNPAFPFKYLGQCYLARGLAVQTRASCFLHQCRRMKALFTDEFLWQALEDNVLLHEIHEKGNTYRILLALESTNFHEGGLTLLFESGGAAIYVLGFSIVPGWAVGMDAPDVLLISRLQGKKGCHAQLGLAAKALHDICPASLLIAALLGVAKALGIGAFAGVSAAMQGNNVEQNSLTFIKAYDELFVGLGATLNESGFYCSSIPLREKPLELVKSSNRLRTKIGRSLKRKVTEDVCRFLREGNVCKAGGALSAEVEAEIILEA